MVKILDFDLLSVQTPESNSKVSRPLIFISPYKSGSTMLFNYTAELFRLLDIKFIDYPTHYFHQHNLLNEFYRFSKIEFYKEPMCYIGQREIPQSLNDCDLKKNYSTFALIRDPRDALVSMYFSFLGSHVPPECLKNVEWHQAEIKKLRNDIDIDNYVISASMPFLNNINRIIAFCNESYNSRILKYEDVLLHKDELVESIIIFIEENSNLKDLRFGNEIEIDKITKLYDIVPSVENESNHIRKAMPGDAIEKLKPETLSLLEDLFSESLVDFYSF